MSEPVEHPEDLYGVDLTDFVAERNALAVRLKADGSAEAAAAVRAMRKPPRSVWALNAIAREHPERVTQVLDAAQAVIAVISEGGDELRGAQAAYGRAVTDCVDAAADRAGLAGDAIEKVRATVLAAGAEPDGPVAESLRSGTLTADADAPGFSFAGVVPSARTPRRTSGSGPEPAAASTRPAPEPDPEAEARAAAQAAARAEQRRRARERQQLEQEVSALEQRAGRLDGVAEAAETAAAEARATADRAAEELRDAQRRLAEHDEAD